MPKITDYDIIDAGENTKVLGVNEGEVVQVNANSLGGGEQWDNIPFTPTSVTSNSVAATFSKLTFPCTIRVTYQIGGRWSSGGVEFSPEGLKTSKVRLLSEQKGCCFENNICLIPEPEVLARLELIGRYGSGVQLSWDTEITGSTLPEIFKVERLVE